MIVGGGKVLGQPGELFQSVPDQAFAKSLISPTRGNRVCVFTKNKTKQNKTKQPPKKKRKLSDANNHPLTPLNKNYHFKPMQS